jgi:hypothetical protein
VLQDNGWFVLQGNDWVALQGNGWFALQGNGWFVLQGNGWFIVAMDNNFILQIYRVGLMVCIITGRWDSPVSSTNKTDRQDIAEILLKVR